MVDLVSDDEADMIAETPKELAEVGESVPVTPPNIDELAQKWKKLLHPENVRKLSNHLHGPRDDIAYVDVSGKKDSEDLKDGSPGGEVVEINISSKRSIGEKALREEAKSKGHLLCHMPKNPYCPPCQKARMLKPPSYASGGSKHIDAKIFAEHLTADFLIAATDEESRIGWRACCDGSERCRNQLHVHLPQWN